MTDTELVTHFEARALSFRRWAETYRQQAADALPHQPSKHRLAHNEFLRAQARADELGYIVQRLREHGESV